MRTLALVLGLGVLVLALAPQRAAAAPADGVSARALTDAFFRTVFGLEYGLSHPDAYRVKRFVRPVAFHVSDLSGLGRRAQAHLFLRRLPQEIAHLDSAVVAREAEANFRIFLVREGDFHTVVANELRADARAMNARCLVGVTTETGRITSATAVIVADDDYLFRRCLVEEVLQGLGPMNDSDDLVHSVFNDRSDHDHFTAFDRALLNLLYHPAIEPGMTGAQAQRALPAALFDLGLLR